MIARVGEDVIGCPDGVFVAARSFLVAGFHDFRLFVEIGTDEEVEVILVAATVAAVVKDDARQLIARSFHNGLEVVVEQLRTFAVLQHHWHNTRRRLPQIGHFPTVRQFEENIVVTNRHIQIRHIRHA